jgi:hypothetical protein
MEMCIAASAKDSAELLLVFLRCSGDPQKLWRQSCLSLVGPSQSPNEALKALKSIQDMPPGHEAAIANIERLINSHVPDLGLGLANGANNKKRKSSQSSKKRKRRHQMRQDQFFA